MILSHRAVRGKPLKSDRFALFQIRSVTFLMKGVVSLTVPFYPLAQDLVKPTLA
jgi:hypothetical protein